MSKEASYVVMSLWAKTQSPGVRTKNSGVGSMFIGNLIPKWEPYTASASPGFTVLNTVALLESSLSEQHHQQNPEKDQLC
jgi:hypothetical protein